MKEITRKLELPRGLAKKALTWWFTSRGFEVPDGRSRRQTLATKHSEPAVYQQVADAVKRLADRGLLFHEVGAMLGLDRNTITAAWAYWHTSRGLPVPDGRARRKSLERKSSREN